MRGRAHALANPIDGILHWPHEMANSLILPHVLRLSACHTKSHYAALAGILFQGCAGQDAAKAEATNDAA